jgi:hypothetical protein
MIKVQLQQEITKMFISEICQRIKEDNKVQGWDKEIQGSKEIKMELEVMPFDKFNKVVNSILDNYILFPFIRLVV